jgi:hypothetical protein
MANTNRNKGHVAERDYMNAFKELGYRNCVTARYGSRLHDDCQVDLLYLPFNVQVKAGHQKGMKPGKVIQEMKELLQENIPCEADKPCLIIHKKHVGRGKKRTETDEMVSMTFEDFKKIIKNDY